MKWIWLLHLACAAALLVQLGSVMWNGYIRPSVTNPVVKEMKLKNMDFPVVFKICVTPGFNLTALNAMGYDDVLDYLLGISKYNSTILGWAGHTNTSRVQGSVAGVLRKVRAHTVEEVISQIELYGIDDVDYSIHLSNVHLGRVNYQDNCYTLDIASNADVKEHGVKQLYITFKSLESRSVAVYIKGRSISCDRNIKAHLLYSEGADILLQKTNLTRRFVVNLKKNVFVAEDPTKNCRNYPSPDYASYRDCDDQWMKDNVARLAPGLVPIWLTDNTEKVAIQHPAPKHASIWDMLDGTSISDCPLPCSTIYTETRFISEAVIDDSYIDITFSPSVQVTMTDFVKPTLSSFLSDVGGSVGLWLGLGALQAAEIVFNCVLPRIRRLWR
jgi:hypothetical protein